MRRFAWLLVIAILGIVFAVGNSYLRQKAINRSNAPAQPSQLPAGLSAKASKWEWANNQGDKPKAIIRAASFREIKDPPSTELEGLELLLYDSSGTKYDLVESAQARFTKGDRVLFSESDVKITMGIPEGGERPNRVLEIKSSGVRFELDTNNASTEKPVWFKFGQGEGKAVGAAYNPALRELTLRSGVELTWHGPKTMQVEAGEALYKENESKVYLKPWAKLTRDALVLNAQASVIELDKGVVRRVDAANAVGTDKQKGRTLEYGADGLRLDFNAKGQAEGVEGTGNARLASTNEREHLLMNAGRVKLDFLASAEDSVLQKAFAQGSARVESKPAARPNVQPAETKVLASDSIEMKMRPGGEEIERLDTMDPGVIELLPNRPTQRKRRLEGERIYMTYGKNNMLEQLHSVKSATRTEPAALPASKAPPVLTWSQDLVASFSPVNGELAKLEQWTNFRYQEGGRQATAERAMLEQEKNEINLTGKARVWDATGSTDADAILLDQKTGDFSATGRVRSVREGERKTNAAGLMNGSEPVRATANQMFSTAKNTQVRYEGRAVMWQGANRLSADRIDIDRPAQVLKANGQVVSQLLDRQANPKTPGQVFTIVRAPELLYSDKDQFAHYRGGSVLLTRPGLRVKGEEIRAYLSSNENSQSNWEGPNGGLEKAFADGKVEIVESQDTKSRQGWGDHAEYYPGEARLVLEGRRPKMVDLLAGIPQRTTEGKSLVWFANNDRLIVDGEENRRAISNLRKK